MTRIGEGRDLGRLEGCRLLGLALRNSERTVELSISGDGPAAHMSGREPAIGASDEIDFGTDRANPKPVRAQAIPESHPVLTPLNELFGDYTFFIDSDGLSIVEPIDGPAPRRTQAARVVSVANWSDESLANLAAHEPEPTDAIVELGYKH